MDAGFPAEKRTRGLRADEPAVKNCDEQNTCARPPGESRAHHRARRQVKRREKKRKKRKRRYVRRKERKKRKQKKRSRKQKKRSRIESDKPSRERKGKQAPRPSRGGRPRCSPQRSNRSHIEHPPCQSHSIRGAEAGGPRQAGRMGEREGKRRGFQCETHDARPRRRGSGVMVAQGLCNVCEPLSERDQKGRPTGPRRGIGRMRRARPGRSPGRRDRGRGTPTSRRPRRPASRL